MSEHQIEDIMQYILATYYPKVEWAGQENSFPVEQATWHDSPAYGYDIIQQLNNLALWGTSMWEGPKLYFEQEDLTKYDWKIRTDDPGVKVIFQGDSIEDFANGVSVSYTDFNGVKRILYPDAHEELRDPNPNNPATLQGEALWTDVEVPWPCLEGEALQFGRAYLAEFNRPKRPGSYTISAGYIRDNAEHWQEGSTPRCSETVGIMDHPDDSPRLITATSWDDETKVLSITVDAPEKVLDAIVARQSVGRQARNLA